MSNNKSIKLRHMSSMPLIKVINGKYQAIGNTYKTKKYLEPNYINSIIIGF